MYSITLGAPEDDWYAQTYRKKMAHVNMIVKPLSVQETSLVYMLTLSSC